MEGNMKDKIVLQPLSVGQLLDKAFRLYRDHFLTLIGITAAVLAPVAVLQILRILFLPQEAQAVDSFFSGIANTMAIIALAAAFSKAYLSGPPRMRESLAFKRFFSVLGANILMGLSIGVPAALLGICTGMVGIPFLALFAVALAALFLGTRWGVTTQAIVLEDIGALDGMRRSWMLTENHFWRVLGTSMAAALLVYLIYLIPFAFAYSTSTGWFPLGLDSTRTVVLQSLISQLALVIIYPLQSAVQVLIYYDLRIRVEGFDLAYAAGGGRTID
jgi:hypothetical protein